MDRADKRRSVISAVLLAAAAAFIAVGMGRGETAEVFTKAVNICLECIGLG